MSNQYNYIAEKNFENVGNAFSKQSVIFDSIDDNNEILQWMRNQVHVHCMNYFQPGNRLLEINCGTGIDAIYFSGQGLHVHATDLSEGMLNEFRKKINAVVPTDVADRISIQRSSYTDLQDIKEEKFNHIFSNFGGLNCEQHIEKVIALFNNLLVPGGTATLVIMPPVCPWEILHALKGNFKTAFRRFKKDGADSNVEGIHFKSYYFTAKKIITSFGDNYKVLDLQGLAGISPPPYLEKFPKRFPRIYKTLTRMDEKASRIYPFNRWADHFIITMQRKD